MTGVPPRFEWDCATDRPLRWSGGQPSIQSNSLRRIGLASCLGVLGIVVLGLACVAGSARADVQTSPSAESRQQTRIAELIKQLGAQDYPRRRLAARELRRIGITAIDQLLHARTDADVEIRFQADNLLNEIRIPWASDDDPTVVQRTLSGYQEMSEAERMMQVSVLANALDQVGLPWLCRIARYDPSENVSKYAAAELIAYPHLDDPDVVRQIVEMIDESGELPTRVSMQWLNTYAKYLQSPQANMRVWRELIEVEALLIRKAHAEIVRGPLTQVVKWYIAELLKHDELADARTLLQSYLLDSPERSEVYEVAQWLLDVRGQSLFDELVQASPNFFQETAIGLYLHAEAKVKAGQIEDGETFAQRAFDLGNGPDAVHTRNYLLGVQLEHRGLQAWAIREYVAAIAGEKDESDDNIRTRLTLSELYHDRLDDKSAAETLTSMVELAKKSPQFARRVAELGREPAAIESRMHFFWAEHHRQLSEREAQVERLKQAVAADPTDADVLIAMHRLENADSTWRQETSRLIREAVQHFETSLQEAGTNSLERVDFRDQGYYRQMEMASFHNQLAWLISNSEGDFQAAIEHSRQSLDYRMQAAGYLDTLGRCYYAANDLKRALRYQRLAVHLEPGSQQIKRQLAQFEAENKQAP